ncbi:hypothetical protein [uncultured Enterovirga sp.]|uniref:hypothetical protein n=1 Tax=uncultured Enterovirga sp. TaxID=2026352 RepID=UPI0035CA6CCA
MPDPRDPRSESEKARADLKRNDEMGLAIPESEMEQRPSVTPETFGEHSNVEVETGPVDREKGEDPLPGGV